MSWVDRSVIWSDAILQFCDTSMRESITWSGICNFSIAIALYHYHSGLGIQKGMMPATQDIKQLHIDLRWWFGWKITLSHIGFVFLRDTKENFRRKFSCLMPKTNGSASVSYSFSAPPRNSVYHLVQLHDSWIVICFLKKQTIFLHDIATSIQFCLFSNRILFGETRYKESWKIFKIYSYLLIDSPRKKSGKRLNRNQKKYIRSQKSKLTYLLGCQVIYMLHEKKLNVSLRACILTFNLISFCVNDQDPLQTRVPKWQRCWYYVYVKVFNANQSLAAKFNAFYFNSLFTLDEYWNFQNTIPKRRTWNWP